MMDALGQLSRRRTYEPAISLGELAKSVTSRGFPNGETQSFRLHLSQVPAFWRDINLM